MPLRNNGLSAYRSLTKNADRMIDTNKLRINKDYFLDKFDKHLIGISYLFSPDQIGWLNQHRGNDWHKIFVKGQMISNIDNGYHHQSSLKGF
jgi:hypothetical protein